MYAGSGFSRSELGDVDVLYHDGQYHLFHLVLPNHDYIAHAVSSDGFMWRRVQNAIFIGDPGAWDDDMLWTMHVSPDPDRSGQWRMFYTGLCRKEEGRIQRVGLARSSDLYSWQKDTTDGFPLELSGPEYESTLAEGRHWVSFRDPFFYHEGEHRLLLANGRVAKGPIVRRGCVAMFRELKGGKFELRPPLMTPHMYDDVEVPVLFKMDDHYYLAGSIREDVKVHYWHASSPNGPFQAFYDNLLLPQGNYAARIMKDEQGRHLLWNFFIHIHEEEAEKLLPPPKLLDTLPDKRLVIRSYPGFDEKVTEVSHGEQLLPVLRILGNPLAEEAVQEEQVLRFNSRSGHEMYAFQQRHLNFRLRTTITLHRRGKTGFFFRTDEDANGCFISLDLVNGLAQYRHWGQKGPGLFDDSFRYANTQENHFEPNPELNYHVEVIAYGGYVELSVNRVVVLSLIDTTYTERGHIGIYAESAEVYLCNLEIQNLHGPVREDYGPI